MSMIDKTKLKPGLIIEGFKPDYSAIEQFKLVYKDEEHKEMNWATNKKEPLWEVRQQNRLCCFFEDEICMHYWEAGTNNNIAYDSWTIIKA